MTEVVVIGLTGALVYLGWRWNGYKAENMELRMQIASLKRQLMKYRRTQ
jgi:hypothetical protein